MYSNLRNRTILFGLLFLIAPLAIQLFAVRPLQHSRAVLTQEIKADIQKNSTVFSRLQQSFQESNRERQRYEASTLPQALLDKDSVITFFTGLEALGNSRDIAVTITFGSELKQDTNGVQTIATTIHGRGEYMNILSFLRSLEQEPYYVTSTSISIVRAAVAGESSTNPQIELIINGETNWK
ncbi:MAG: hypothetical protein HYV34_02740 [Candidatus Kerfeldbacteria bacterium]|nr:hypothetical protein [Candidatus Kerfeldbacteria bacterium]